MREQAAPLIPQLVVRGALVRRARDDEASRDWRVHAALQWRTPGASPTGVARTPARPATRPGLPCANERLCAWERREVARAEALLRRLAREERP